jgi:nucleotide-binding universal stress UspA family protein
VRKPIRRYADVKGPVICGVDDSSVAVGAVEVARELAQRYELPLVYAHVLEGSSDGQEAERLVHNAVAPAHAEIAIEHGHPADRLVTLAKERQASFLVVGNHGPRSSLLGSISADVARRASCPVVIVPTTAALAPPQTASEPGVEGGIVRFALGRAVRRVA